MSANIKTIKKSIDIRAPKEKVWDVLVRDECTRKWYAAFSEGSHADTDWKEGSKAVFTDHSGSGIFGTVVVSKPGELLSVAYEGMIKDGKDDYESEEAKNIKGSRETYRLSGKDGVTHLDIECDMDIAWFDMMSAAWDKAVQIIKELSEGKGEK